MRGSLTQRSAGSWTIQVSGGFDDGGKRVRITQTVRGNRKDAERALTKMLRDVDTGTIAMSGATPFGKYLTERWLPHMRSRVGTEAWERYESLVRVHVVPRCGRVKLGKLKAHHLQRVVDEMIEDGAAAASVVKAKVLIKASLDQAVRWQLLAVNPAAGISPPTVRRAKLRIPTDKEMRKLVDAAAKTDYALPVLLAATTGMRRGEIVALTWSAVDFDRTVKVEDVDVPAPAFHVLDGKTNTARRTVSLPPSTVTALRAHKAAQNERRLLCGAAWRDLGLVVDRGDGSPLNPDSLSHAFADIAEDVGLPDVRLHDLRHGFATALLRAGVNVKGVSEALGHSRSSFTMDVYQHVLPGMGEQVASVIETALGEGGR
jgi:integrase